MDMFLILNEALLILVTIALLTLVILIPSRERILKGEAGERMRSKLVPIILFSVILISILLFPLVLLFVEDFIALLITNGLLFSASVLMGIHYLRNRKLLDSVAVPQIGAEIDPPQDMAQSVAKDAPGPNPVQQDHQKPYPSQPTSHQHHQDRDPPGEVNEEMTVECPQCRAHISIPAGSTDITCPYCGLTGSL